MPIPADAIRYLLFIPLILLRPVMGSDAIGTPIPSAIDSSDFPPRPLISVTFSGFQLLVPKGVIKAEMRTYPKLGLGIIAGAGRITQRTPGMKIHVALYDLGVLANYYLLGDFRRGMQLGFRGIYNYYVNPFIHQYPVSGRNVMVGSLLGYKHAMKMGFTYEAQIGCQYLWLRQSNGISGGIIIENESLAPILDLGLGWSF